MTPYHMPGWFRGAVGRLAVCLALLLPLAGQEGSTPEQDVQREAMKKFAFLVGKWSGESRWFTVKGVLNLTATEDVHYEQGGLTLKIDGREVDKSSGKPVGRGVYVISYDEKSGEYRAQGGVIHHQECKLNVHDDWQGLTIDFAQPTLATRTVLRLHEGYWNEMHWWVTSDSEMPQLFLLATLRRQETPRPGNTGSRGADSSK